MSRKEASRRTRRKGFASRPKQSRRVTNKASLAAFQKWFLPDHGIFAKLNFHRNTKWAARNLVWLAVCWTWVESANLTDSFAEAYECCYTMTGFSSLRTYQGFMGALVTWTPQFLEVLIPLLQQQMLLIGGTCCRIGKWLPIAFDGSRVAAPRTKANEKAFCAPNFGKGTTAKYRKKKSKGMRRKQNQKHKPQPPEPQVWVTMMWLISLRLPWSWMLGPSNSSERGHVMELLKASVVPAFTLYCGDAGFIGYEFWSAIIDQGSDFLVRVGANVTLLLENTDYQPLENGLVLCWPKGMQDKKLPPLRLRLVKVPLGKTFAWMLTSVLDPAELTDAELLAIYKKRWGIEVEFRGLKQTLDRAKLRCRNDQRLLAELNWAILGMAIAELFALKEQLEQRAEKSARRNQSLPNTEKRSLAKTIRALRHCMRHLDQIPEGGKDLPSALWRAVTDSYQRKVPKRARYRPPNPDKKPLGDPKLRPLTLDEQKKLSKLTRKIAA